MFRETTYLAIVAPECSRVASYFLSIAHTKKKRMDDHKKEKQRPILVMLLSAHDDIVHQLGFKRNSMDGRIIGRNVGVARGCCLLIEHLQAPDHYVGSVSVEPAHPACATSR